MNAIPRGRKPHISPSNNLDLYSGKKRGSQTFGSLSRMSTMVGKRNKRIKLNVHYSILLYESLLHTKSEKDMI